MKFILSHFVSVTILFFITGMNAFSQNNDQNSIDHSDSSTENPANSESQESVNKNKTTIDAGTELKVIKVIGDTTRVLCGNCSHVVETSKLTDAELDSALNSISLFSVTLIGKL